MNAIFQGGRGEPISEVEYRTLRRLSRTIAAHHDIRELFCSLGDELRPVIDFSLLQLFLCEEKDRMRLHISEAGGENRLHLAEPPQESTEIEWVYDREDPIVFADLDQEARFPALREILGKCRVRSYCAFPLTAANRRLGVFGVGGDRPRAYTEENLHFLSLIADQIAVAIDDALNIGALRNAQTELENRNQRLKLLLDVNNSIASNLDLKDLVLSVSSNLQRVMRADFAGVALPGKTNGRLCGYAYQSHEGPGPGPEHKALALDERSAPSVAFRTGKPAILHAAELKSLAGEDDFWRMGIQEACSLPLISREKILGTLDLGRLQPIEFTAEEIELVTQIANQVAIAVDNALAYDQIARLKNELALEKLYLESEIRSEMNFADIVGKSPALRAVLQQVETVAATDSTVLLLGETGTGKELMARAIHERSQRRSRAFVKLNCAAIPTGLLESEMFGHEKGAFTGAVAQRIGRFELAHGGTIFLDEVGEIPLDLQPKLLRVLQEREFERLGSSRTFRTDARLIAATNADLEAMVDEKRFRADLFYRLNVFPIFIPPLRERLEDIPMLVSHFVQLFAHRVNKRIDSIASETMAALVRYSWPGNIRELQNVTERAVLLSNGPVLKVSLADLKARNVPAPAPREIHVVQEQGQPIRNVLEDVERRQILSALEQTNGIVAGPNGAAAKLGLKRSTLQLRMKKLGIATAR